jgi:tRNA nucleotidyltransferase (CCA-adding enzyme)
LLGSDSNDIDVALENVMGVAFADNFVEYVSTVKKLPVKSVSKVESNPDQSKHLETAKTTVLDTELDFVNLRSEEYAEGSRIPTEVVNTLALYVCHNNDNLLLARLSGHHCKML